MSTRSRLAALLISAAIGSGVAPVWAQGPTRPSPAAAPAGPSRVLVSIGGGWRGADRLGSASATTRQTTPGTTTPPAATLFDTTSSLAAAPSAEAAVAVAVTRAWILEARTAIGQTTMRTAISRDAEGAQSVVATQSVSELVVDGSVLRQFTRPRMGSRGTPYVLAGVGYLRQLHEDRVLVDTGTTAHVGAGVRWRLAAVGRRRRDAGLTTELRWTWRRDGITLRDDVRSMPSLSLRGYLGL